MNAFIVDIASFLPNTPISNDQMEELLGMVGRLPSRTRKIMLLNEHIIPMIVRDRLAPVAAKHGLQPEKVTWYLPHYSSDYFRPKLAAGMEEIGFTIPLKRWFTNLATKGNTGSASIYIMLEELFHSGKLRVGDTILCMIPESGRFSCGFMHLSVV